uniref:Uncharacterized protein n=1 Tax=Arundo donax TaxID=35708 RepID=A0A0A9HM69_ARUDO
MGYYTNTLNPNVMYCIDLLILHDLRKMEQKDEVRMLSKQKCQTHIQKSHGFFKAMVINKSMEISFIVFDLIHKITSICRSIWIHIFVPFC